jgi:hypothetical protein
MDKTIADHLGFDINKEIVTTGLTNTSDATKPPFIVTTVPAKDPKEAGEAATTWVLTLIPVTFPIAYGKMTPLGPIDSQEIKPLLQANHDTVFAWASAVQHAIEKTGGNSFHLSATEPDTFNRLIPARQHTYWKAHLTTSVFIKPKVLTPDNEDYKILTDHVNTAVNQLFEVFINEDVDAKKAYSSSSSPVALTTTMASAFTNLVTKW